MYSDPTPLRGYAEAQYYACRGESTYDARLKNYVDKVMRFCIKTFLDPGLTISFQSDKALTKVYCALQKKLPDSNFGLRKNRVKVRARIRKKLHQLTYESRR